MGIIFVNPSVSIGTYSTPSFDNVVGNTGNLVWWHGCKKGIKFSEEIQLDDLYKKEYSENDVLVVPVANNIDHGETAFSKKLRKLMTTKASVVLIGLGIQANGEFEIDRFVRYIPDSKKRLLQTLSQKCVSIGVRGELAKLCLNKLGIYNVKVIGCPSFYSNMIGNENSRLNDVKGKIKEILINNTDIKKEKKCIERLIDIYKGGKYKLIRQSEHDEFLNNEIENMIFFDYNQWNDFLRKDYDLCIGTRLHGNMMAFLNNIPAIWVTHDYRLSDICEVLRLPHFDMEDYINVDNDKIYRCLEQYDESFYKNRNRMLDEYKSFLEENGVQHFFY